MIAIPVRSCRGLANRKNAPVERGTFSAVQNVVLGSKRHSVRRNDLVAVEGQADLARPSQISRFPYAPFGVDFRLVWYLHGRPAP
jgi:hypothetical protein